MNGSLWLLPLCGLAHAAVYADQHGVEFLAFLLSFHVVMMLARQSLALVVQMRIDWRVLKAL